MEKKIKALLDYQRFSPNGRLEKMIAETERRYSALSDDDLSFVAAAGEEVIISDPNNGEAGEGGTNFRL